MAGLLGAGQDSSGGAAVAVVVGGLEELLDGCGSDTSTHALIRCTVCLVRRVTQWRLGLMGTFPMAW